ncbi:hypothetical protein QE430_000115 [Microbacterium testaceum]|nr:hypothetical protein [Microbacterium testaceum]
MAGGNIATYFQMLEPVNPVTIFTPSFAASRAVFFISSAARCRTPSGSPSPHTRSDTMSRWRWSIGSSQTAWPLRWLAMANTFSPWRSSTSSLPCT